MELKTYSSALDFLRDAEGMLEKQELDNNLILGISRSLGQTRDWTHVFLCVFDHGEAVACSIKTWAKALSYSSVSDPRAAALLANYYRDNGITLSGVFAETRHARQFARFYGGTAKETGLLVHELKSLNKLPEFEGEARQAKEDDLELIVNWVMQFEVDADIHPLQSREQIEAASRVRVGRGDFWLWVHGSEPVSMAAVMRRTKSIGIVGLVYTPREFRGRGYGTAVTKAVSEYLLASGLTSCGLFTDIANLTSNAIYARIGYVPFMEFSDIDFRNH